MTANRDRRMPPSNGAARQQNNFTTSRDRDRPRPSARSGQSVFFALMSAPVSTSWCVSALPERAAASTAWRRWLSAHCDPRRRRLTRHTWACPPWLAMCIAVMPPRRVSRERSPRRQQHCVSAASPFFAASAAPSCRRLAPRDVGALLQQRFHGPNRRLGRSRIGTGGMQPAAPSGLRVRVPRRKTQCGTRRRKHGVTPQ